MPLTRRALLQGITGVAAAAVGTGIGAGTASDRGRIKAVAFDAFTLLDPRPVFALAEQLFPAQGSKLAELWRVRQFEYQWLRALGNQYRDFERVTEDALRYAAASLRLDLTDAQRHRLTHAYLELDAWPDAAPVLRALKGAGLRLAFLSNATPRMLEAAMQRPALKGVLEPALSTHAIRTYKPDPRAYALALEAFDASREQVCFVAFAGWDAAGASWFGYPTFWLNRLGVLGEELGGKLAGTGRQLIDLQRFLLGEAA